MSKGFTCLVWLAVFLAFAANLPKAYAESFTAEFIEAEGGVTVTREDGSEVQARIGMVVGPGDTITTGPEGIAEILYEDGNVTVLDEETRIKIVALEVNEKKESNSVLDMAVGSIKNSVTKLVNTRTKFEVHTKSAVAGVTGTPPWVVTVKGGKGRKPVTEVDLLGKPGDKGSVFVQGTDRAKKKVNLKPATRTVAIKGQPPVRPTSIAASRLEQLSKKLPIRTPEKKRKEKRRKMQQKVESLGKEGAETKSGDTEEESKEDGESSDEDSADKESGDSAEDDSGEDDAAAEDTGDESADESGGDETSSEESADESGDDETATEETSSDEADSEATSGDDSGTDTADEDTGGEEGDKEATRSDDASADNDAGEGAGPEKTDEPPVADEAAASSDGDAGADAATGGQADAQADTTADTATNQQEPASGGTQETQSEKVKKLIEEKSAADETAPPTGATPSGGDVTTAGAAPSNTSSTGASSSGGGAKSGSGTGSSTGSAVREPTVAPVKRVINTDAMMDHISRNVSVGETVKAGDTATGEETEKSTNKGNLPNTEEEVLPSTTRVKIRVNLK